MMYVVTVLVVLILMAVVVYITVYNGLTKLKVMAENAWSDVDVQLTRRHDLIPNLVETVKGYARHESDTLEKVVNARNRAISASDPGQKIEAENQLSGALRQLFALSEAYPDLKANVNFLEFQRELTGIEDQIVNARRYYNAVARDFNTRQLSFPSNMIARSLGFTTIPFYEADEGQREAVRVDFQ